MHKLPSSPNKGFSILELVVALALSAALFVGLSKALSFTQSFRKRAEVENDVFLTDSLLAAEIRSILRGYDAQPLTIEPVIHKDGVIRFASGKPNQIMRSTASLRPRPSSEAISALLPEYRYALKIYASNQNTSRTVEGCEINYPIPDLSLYRSALTISIDGISESLIHARRSVGKNGCYNITLVGQEGIIYPALSSDEIHAVRLIIPVAQEFTVYLSNAGELRYLGHVGEENIENQPIASRVEDFRAAISDHKDPALLAIKLVAKVHSKEIVKTGLSRSLKVNYAELLLNLPK